MTTALNFLLLFDSQQEYIPPPPPGELFWVTDSGEFMQTEDNTLDYVFLG